MQLLHTVLDPLTCNADHHVIMATRAKGLRSHNPMPPYLEMASEQFEQLKKTLFGYHLTVLQLSILVWPDLINIRMARSEQTRDHTPVPKRHMLSSQLMLCKLPCCRYRDQRDRPDLSNPESMQLYLETRFEQLKVACDLDLWQEAFRSVEDIQGLLSQSKKAPKPQMMATYYAKLTKIFTVSDSHLYNGYAW